MVSEDVSTAHDVLYHDVSAPSPPSDLDSVGRRYLNLDIERLILEYRLLGMDTRSSDVSELSFICKEYHEIVSAWRWRHIQWPRYVETIGRNVKTIFDGQVVQCSAPPRSVARFIRCIYIACHLTKVLNWDDLLPLLRDLSGLTTATFDLSLPPPSTFIDALLSIPTFSSLEMISMPLIIEPLAHPRSSSSTHASPAAITTPATRSVGLRHILLTRPAPWACIDDGSPVSDMTLYLPHYHTRPPRIDFKRRMANSEDHAGMDIEFAWSLISEPHTSLLLTRLEIDIGLVMFETLGRLDFPRLEILIFHGLSPPTIVRSNNPDNDYEYSLTKLTGMRGLRELRFVFIKDPRNSSSTSSTSTSFWVIPPSHHPAEPPLSSSTRETELLEEDRISRLREKFAILFPILEIFALSNPNAEDLIFHTLPTSVHTIHLSSVCVLAPAPTQFGPNRTASSHVNLRTGGRELQMIVQALRSDSERKLYDLRVRLQGELELELLQCIAEAFPELRRLEIKRLRSTRTTNLVREEIMENEESPAERECIMPLTRLTHLTHLRLPIISSNIPLIQLPTSTPLSDGYDGERLVVSSLVPLFSTSLKVLGLYHLFGHTSMEQRPGGRQISRSILVPGWCDWFIERENNVEDGLSVKNIRPVCPRSRQVPVRKSWLKLFDTRSLY